MHGRMERLIDELDVHASYNIYVMILNFLNEVNMLDGFLFSERALLNPLNQRFQNVQLNDESYVAESVMAYHKALCLVYYFSNFICSS